MKDKEKQIEEMASDMDYSCTKRDLYPDDAKEIAKVLYLLGYRKLPEDSVVLSREGYEKLTAPRLFIKPRELNQKELAEKLKNEKYGIIGVDESNIEIIPSRIEIEKETAEKILKPLYYVIMEHPDCCVNLSEDIKFLMEKYDIDLENEE